MKAPYLKVLVPGIFAAFALAMAVSVGAQTPPPAAPPPAAPSTHAAPMPGHYKHSAVTAKHAADMRAECAAKMAKHQETQAKLQAMNADLDRLVAEMNAAKGSKEPDALEKPMAAVINELVAQRKVFLSMMTDMQPAMMTHMMHHMNMHEARGSMECPMMKTGTAPEPKAEENKPKM
jgi:Skp family chaperone for outer membrane proteins